MVAVTTPGTKLCPSCGVENPVSRVTCQACKQPFSKTVKQAKTDSLADKPAPAPTPPPAARKPDPAKTPDKAIEKVITGQNKPVRKRSRPKKKAEPMQLFQLIGDKLIPVSLSTNLRSMLRKQIDPRARAVMDVWNRNKALIIKG